MEGAWFIEELEGVRNGKEIVLDFTSALLSETVRSDAPADLGGDLYVRERLPERISIYSLQADT